MLQTLSPEGEIAPNRGKIVTQTIQNDSITTLISLPNAVKTIFSTQSSKVATLSDCAGLLFTAGVNLDVSEDMLPFDAPKDVAVVEETVYLGSEYSHDVDVGAFGQNLGKCIFEEVQNHQEGDDEMLKVTIANDKQSVGFVWTGDDKKARVGSSYDSQVILRCNGWVSATTGVSIHVVDHENNHPHHENSSAVLNFVLNGVLVFILFFI